MVIRIGHRGAAGHVPGNTLAAIEQGIELGAQMVEIDVRRSREGRLLLLHDATVDPTTGGHGPIAALTWAEVRSLRVAGVHPVPLLEEALRLASGRVGVMLELKTEGLAADVVRCVRETTFAGSVIYASFLHDQLLEIRRADPDAQTLALIEGVPVNRTAFAVDAQATHVGVGREVLSRSFVEDLQAISLKVFVYTVNDPDEIRAVAAMGVDGIVSDYPERLAQT
jgi:glycerophosphoryl diester phosphodiesterase